MNTELLYKRLLTVATVAAISLGMASCIDNADNSTKPSDNQQQTAETAVRQAKAEKFWTVVSQLVDVDDYTDDYEDKTFEPTYGAEGAQAGTRYVYTNDAATAAARFADLVEQEGIDETTEKYIFNDPDVGTLVYTKGSGRTLATVDVDIKQIPKLRKIVYVPSAYANAKFDTKAYYRFGDVVTRQMQGYPNEDVTEYWICVRPSFGPEGKGDSHWVCLNVLPKKNVWHYVASNGNKYWLPKGIGTNKEHMQNLAEMLYAIYLPEEWEDNVKKYAKNGLKMFHDFDPAKYKLHNQYFWKNVRNEWTRANILENALNFNGSVQDFQNRLRYGLRLLYKGHSWWTLTSWDCTLYEGFYKSGDVNNEKNMHKVEFHDKTSDVHTVDLLDCRKMGSMYFDNYKQFFYYKALKNSTPYWVIRHATGKELASDGQYDKMFAITGVIPVYRYYENAVLTRSLYSPPEETPKPEGDPDDDEEEDDDDD